MELFEKILSDEISFYNFLTTDNTSKKTNELKSSCIFTNSYHTFRESYHDGKSSINNLKEITCVINDDGSLGINIIKNK